MSTMYGEKRGAKKIRWKGVLDHLKDRKTEGGRDSCVITGRRRGAGQRTPFLKPDWSKSSEPEPQRGRSLRVHRSARQRGMRTPLRKS